MHTVHSSDMHMRKGRVRVLCALGAYGIPLYLLLLLLLYRWSYANKFCVHSSKVLLLIVSVISSLICAIILVIYFPTDRKNLSQFLHYYAYPLLPMLICVPLAYIVQFLEVHCRRGEYISIAADQRPPDPRDWDVESGTSIKTRQHYIANSMQGESGNSSEVLDEKEETLLIKVRDNIEFTKNGATRL